MKELSVICKINLLNLNSVASYSTSSAAVRTGIFSGTGAALSVNFHKDPCWSRPPQSAMRPRDALKMHGVLDELPREDTRPRWRGKGVRRGDNAIQTGIGVSQLNQKKERLYENRNYPRSLV